MIAPDSLPPPDTRLQDFAAIGDYMRTGRMPWRASDCGGMELRALEAFPHDAVRRRFPLRSSRYVPRRIFEHVVRRRFDAELADAAVHALRRAEPAASAYRLLSGPQAFAAALTALAVAAGAFFAPLATLIALNAAITLYFIAAIGFRALLASVAFSEGEDAPARPALSDDALPVVTILLPVCREAEGLAGLAAAMRALDYPRDRLDIKLILEADDRETLAEARRLGLDAEFDCVVVPDLHPRTKPKACNYALPLARGELIVIYDAEDSPEADQLRKAAAAFASADEDLVCVQARLNFYNAEENWLTRLFALEYALWFDCLLPALEKLRIPIPLGGTSNIFRTASLVELGGWDPYNVTEDADLGLRIARRGLRTAILDSTTFEEANSRLGNWLRQRSRWMKGYIQTWLVHMRDPGELRRVSGWRGFLAVQVFVAGNVVSALVNPILWTGFLYWLVTRSDAIASFFPGPLLALNLFALLIGNSFFVYLAAIGGLKRGWVELAPHALLAPVYWWLTSLAAYKALWEIFSRPHFWEKTDHMLSETARAGRRAATGPALT